MDADDDHAFTRNSPPGRLIDVAGRTVHAQVAGAGSPCVVLEAGLPGGSSLDWSLVTPQVAEFTTVVAYDRAGIGWSTPTSAPRTMRHIASELRQLLTTLDVPPPFVLVGQSGGGLITRTFQQLDPDLVGGLVLVDASHEDQLARIPGARQELRRIRRDLTVRSWLVPTGIMRPLLARRFGAAPQRLLPRAAFHARVAMETRHRFLVTARQELDAIEESMQELRERSRKHDRPTIVLTAGANQCAEWHELQAELAAHSCDSRHRTLPGVGHDIHLEAPDEVVRAVREIARGPRNTDAIADREGP
jgi:pimeloyl-ACP methyl ester carboxylesterase